MNLIRDVFFKSPVITGFAAFAISLSFGVYLSLKEYQLDLKDENSRVLLTAEQIEDQIQSIISTANSSVNILAYLVQTERVENNFNDIGKSIIDNISIIDQIQLLDSGVIIATYPLSGNESVIGYDILADQNTRNEAIFAIEKKRLFFAGPKPLRQGGDAIIARLPIFQDNNFVGFAAALISWDKFKDQVFKSFQSNSEFTVDLLKYDPIEGGYSSLLGSDFSNSNGPLEDIRINEGNWIVRVQLSHNEALNSILPMLILRFSYSLLLGYLIYKLSLQPQILHKKVDETTRELQLSNQRFNLATKANSEIIWDWDLETDVTIRSENFEKLLGYQPNEKAYQTSFWKSLIHPEDSAEIETNLKKVLNGTGDKWSQEFRIRKSDGEFIYIIDKGLIIRDTEGKAIRMIGSTQDISDRKKTEIELVSQKHRISNVIEGTNAGTWEWNIQTGEIIINEIWANIIGYTLEELGPLNNQTWVKYSHPDDLKEVNMLLQDHLSGVNPSYAAEFRIRHKNGNWIWVLARGKVLTWTPEGKPLMMFGTEVDITQEKLREEEIKITNLRLQSANEELKSFASVASHDMKEPLRMISSFLMLLEKKYTPVLDEKGIQYINFAVDGAKRLSQLTGDMMEYAKIGFDPKFLVRINLNSLIQGVISLKMNEIEEKEAEIKLGSFQDISGIETPIKSVFLNLISNALKYQQEGKRPVISISSKSLDDYLQITVEDNGIGIEKQYFKKIFDIFGRLHSKTEYSGTGLGLALCKKVINQHGGEIWLESIPGEGSKFHFTLKKYESSTN